MAVMTFPHSRAIVSTLLVVATAGCWVTRDKGPETPAQGGVQQVSIHVLVVDDPELAAAVERQWQARTEGEIKVSRASSEELIASNRKQLDADVVIYPSGLLGELAEREWIVPIAAKDLDDPAFARRDVFEVIRLHEVSWGEQVLAVPFGSPQFLLLYRKDLFDRLNLEPPQTWSQYQRLAERLSRRQALGELAPPEEATWCGVSEPLGRGWASQVLLARAAAYASHRSQYSTLFDYSSMEPLIDGPPFVRALEELVKARQFGSPEASTHTPTDARRELLAGRCAMALTWPSRAGDATPRAAPGDPLSVAMAELPGSSDVYNFRSRQWEQRGAEESRVPLIGLAGRLGSVTRQCRRPRPALNMLFLLTGAEMSVEISPQSKHTTLYRESQLGEVARWVDSALGQEATELYGEVVKQTQNGSAWLSSPRIPGRSQYLAALDDAVRAATEGGTAAGEALREAAARWREITKSLGTEAQRLAYMRSVGLEP